MHHPRPYSAARFFSANGANDANLFSLACPLPFGSKWVMHEKAIQKHFI